MLQETGNPLYMQNLELLAAAVSMQGDYRRAALLFGAAKPCAKRSVLSCCHCTALNTIAAWPPRAPGCTIRLSKRRGLKEGR